MAETKTAAPKTVDEYLAALPAQARQRITELLNVARAAAPGATETISYGMPTLKVGKARVHIAAWKSHCGLYGMDGAALAAHHDEVKPYLAEKSTVRFPYAEPLSAALAAGLVKAHIAARRGD